MSELENPFATSPVVQNSVSGSADGVGMGDAETAQLMSSTRPWLIFLGVVGLVFAALTAMAAVIMLVAGIGGGFDGPRGPGGPEGAVFGVVGALAYGFIALLYAIPSVFLLKSASAYGSYARYPTVQGLNDAIRNTTSFFRILGIMAIVMICLLCLAMCVPIIAIGAAGGANGF